jgi:hypothetical protein
LGYGLRVRTTRSVSIVALLTGLVGCGGSHAAASACKGLPVATQRPRGGVLLLGGRLTKRDLCATIGTPRTLTQGAHDEQIWSYKPGPTFTLKDGKVIKIDGRATIGG